MSDFLSAATVPQPLRVLMVEDNPADAELCLHELQRAGYRPHLEVVRTAEEFASTIHAHPTLAEGLMEAAADALGHSIHKG